MRFATEDPIRPINVAPPSRRRELSASEERRYVRAARQLAIARLAAQHLGGPVGERGTGHTAREVALLIEHEMREGRVALGAVPCRETLASLAARYRGGATAIEDYFEAPRSGRPPLALAPALDAFIEDAIDRAVYRSVARLHGAVVREAQRLGVDAPGYAKIKAVVHRLGVARRSAARHGSAAAKFDAIPHSTVPAEYTNQFWTLDEVLLPLWARMWCRRTGRFVSIPVWMIPVQEYRSRAVVGYHLPYPGRRMGPDGVTPMRGGYDSADVLAAVMTAAVPELAPPSTRRFAGRAPEVLRLDRHPTHGRVNPDLDAPPAAGLDDEADDVEWTDDGDDTEAPEPTVPDTAGGDPARERPGVAAWERRQAAIYGEVFERLRNAVSVPALPGRSPDNRGVIESLNKYLKSLCDGMAGHRDDVLPRDRLPRDIPDTLSPEALGAAIAQRRTTTSATGKRIPRLRLVDPEDLPSLDEIGIALDPGLGVYNHERVHPAHGTTPVNAYFESLPRRGRPGSDLVRALLPETRVVEKRGLVHRVDSREFVYAPEADGWMATVGTAVTYRPDPLLRALFAEVNGRMVVLKPLATYAKDVGAKAVAQRQRAVAMTYSLASRASREVVLPPGAWGLDTARGSAARNRASHDAAPPFATGSVTEAPDEVGPASPLEGGRPGLPGDVAPGSVPGPVPTRGPSDDPGPPPRRTPLATPDFNDDPLFG